MLFGAAASLLALWVALPTALAGPSFVHDVHNPLQLFKVEAARSVPDNGVSIAVNSTELHVSGEWFEVSWSGVPNPSYDDMIVLYVPADANPSHTAPAKFKMAARTTTHMATGGGAARFRLINMRADMRFAFVRNGLENPLVIAQTEAIRVVNPNEPTGGHLALTANQGEMLVQWVSRDAGTPVVQWGTTPGQYSSTAQGSSHTYRKEDLCGGVATTSGWLDPGTLQAAVMSDLQPDTRYYYVYGDQALGMSAEISFVSPPLVGPEASVQLFALADMGQAEVDGSNEMSGMLPSLNTTRLMAQHMEGRRLMVHNGDVSYAMGFASSWDVYFDQLLPLASSMPYMTAIGNHERNWPGTSDLFDGTGAAVTDSGGECGVAYERRLRMPTATDDEPWYSFEFGPIHFLQYSTEHPFRAGTKQHSFIINDLKSVNRSRTPWLIVGGHRPFYISSTYQHYPDGDQDVAAALRESLEDAFLEAGVDMTWHGHHHSYQRTCAAYRGECVPPREDGSQAAPVHLVIGHAGCGLCLNVLDPSPAMLEVVRVEHGFMMVDANATHLHCQAMRDLDGSVMDEFSIYKPPAQGSSSVGAVAQATASQ